MPENEQTNEHEFNNTAPTDLGSADQNFFESKRFWLIIVLLITLLSLLPIWSLRFLPLQDYPQRLLQAHMLRTHNDPGVNYNENFVFHLRAGPYITFYVLTIVFSTFLPIETAGKAVISMYILIVALLVLKVSRRSKAYPVSFLPLLFFPFAFNQQYYLGIVNYFFSVPILIFALLDHENLSRGKPFSSSQAWNARPIIRHSLWQLALFFTHPFSFLLYVFLAVLGAILFDRKNPGFKRALVSPLAAALLFSLWFVALRLTTETSADAAAKPVTWLSLEVSFVYYAYMFTGMRFLNGIGTVPVILWAGIFFVVFRFLLAAPKETPIVHRRFLLFFIIATIAVFVLPFSKDHYTYLNLRIATVSYFLLPVCLADIRLIGVWKAIFIMLIAGCLINSVAKQARMSHEVAEIVPTIEKIPLNSAILPLVFDNSSPELDRGSFHPHVHDHNYYHLLVGGGFNPYFWLSPLLPVHYKPGANRPAPGEYYPHLFEWRTHGSYYQYFLLRGAPSEAVLYISKNAELVSSSGKWLLFKRKPLKGK